MRQARTRPKATAVIETGLSTATQHVRRIVLDLFWKFLWLVLAFVGFWIVMTLVVSIVGATPYEGPDLDQVAPIVWIGIAAQLWQTYAPMVAAILIVFALGCVLLWLLLEALFRGGSETFWIYFASGAARTATLLGAAAFLGTMLLQDGTAGTALIALVIFVAIWFLMITAENLVRRDAVQLLGTDLGTLMTTSIVFFAAELAAGILLWGIAAAVVLLASNGIQLMFALMVVALVLLIWTVFHSLLVAVRFSTIDFMRRSLGDE